MVVACSGHTRTIETYSDGGNGSRRTSSNSRIRKGSSVSTPTRPALPALPEVLVRGSLCAASRDSFTAEVITHHRVVAVTTPISLFSSSTAHRIGELDLLFLVLYLPCCRHFIMNHVKVAKFYKIDNCSN
ncbi:hypothetical protein E2C01_046256 [Portunus trituberculatus]|uniref:Uncharacterized protein n=1 Tax=Portunus trituberculatus TaxID=210409 RepID=A0A5B7G5H4_PORTR|nr:hypothetical protein [Portunus trituberculatus]